MSRMPPTVLLRRLPELLAGFATDIPDVPIGELALDSRQIRSGAAFLACRGTREHGLKFLPQALERGAAAVLWEPAPGIAAPRLPVPAVAVERLGERAGLIAARFFGDPARKLHNAGVTGTDGKTSTAYLLAQAFERLGRACLYVGTLGSGRWQSIQPGDQTTPDPINLQRTLHRAVADGCTALAMEVSSHALDQARVAGVSFHTAILTNVGRDHLDYHGTVENYTAAKHRLFELADLKVRILNRDDAAGAKWAAEFAGSTVYGIDGAAPARGHFLLARGLQLGAAGIRFDIDSHAGRGRIESQLLGRFNAYNLLATASALVESGVTIDAACAALSQAQTVPGRIEGFRGPSARPPARPLVVVDYAHTPQALEQVLRALRVHTQGKLWCVFGCGGDRDRGKRPLMAAAVARLADHAIVTDDNPRNEDPAAIVAEIRGGFPAAFPYRVCHNRAQAIEQAVRDAAAGDVVVVAGKGHETTQTYGRDVRAFSDREFVRQLVGQAPEGNARGQR